MEAESPLLLSRQFNKQQGGDPDDDYQMDFEQQRTTHLSLGC